MTGPHCDDLPPALPCCVDDELDLFDALRLKVKFWASAVCFSPCVVGMVCGISEWGWRLLNKRFPVRGFDGGRHFFGGKFGGWGGYRCLEYAGRVSEAA